MLDKTILIIIDGLGDRPIMKLDRKTPLESAYTPNLNKIATQSICGMMSTLGRGQIPGSDVAHLTILGYEIDKYYSGRGPIETAGLGLTLKPGDIALRGNFGTVDSDLIIRDRRAGRITDVSKFVEAIQDISIDGIDFIVKTGTAHRAGLVMRGPNLSASITDGDPHIEGVKVTDPKPTDNSDNAIFTASVLTKFINVVHERLLKHPENKKRLDQGLLPANYLLVRGAGFHKGLPSFYDKYGLKACVIAGAGLYKGVGAYLGMDVIDVDGATGLPNSNVEAKVKAALKAVETYDFVFMHIKAPDSLGEDGNFLGKKEFIEKIDIAVAPLITLMDSCLLIVTADHSTPSELGKHSADPVPIMMKGYGVRVDDITSFNEVTCAKGGLGLLNGIDLMKEVSNLLDIGHLIGA